MNNDTEYKDIPICPYCGNKHDDYFEMHDGDNICGQCGEVLPWDNSYGIEPGDDCWAFRPDMPVSDIADIVGLIIANGWVEWDYTKEPLTVSGSK